MAAFFFTLLTLNKRLAAYYKGSIDFSHVERALDELTQKVQGWLRHVYATVMDLICNPDILQTDHKLGKTDNSKIF